MLRSHAAGLQVKIGFRNAHNYTTTHRWPDDAPGMPRTCNWEPHQIPNLCGTERLLKERFFHCRVSAKYPLQSAEVLNPMARVVVRLPRSRQPVQIKVQ